MNTRILLTAFLASLLVSAVSAGVFSSTETFTKTYPFTPNGAIRLSNVNGSVEIVAWDKPEVLVEAEKRAASDEDLQRIHLNIDAQSDRLTIKTEHEKRAGWFSGDTRGEVRYVLKVPAGVTLTKIDVVNSNIVVQGVRGPVTLATVNGRVRATGVAAEARFESVNGSITVEFDTVAAGQQIKASTVNGSCEFTLPKDTGAHLDISSVNGSKRCAFPITLEKTGRNSLRGTIGNGAATIKVSTVNGGIAIKSK